jgi:hypothetical protein
MTIFVLSNVDKHKDNFGVNIDFSDVIPADATLVLLLTNDGTGYRTEGVCLPHQIYLEKLQKLVDEKGVKDFSIVPINKDTIVRFAIGGK